jgi:Sulfotransferase family
MSMFLLKDPDALFIHIPKTGGTSIRYGVWDRRYSGPFMDLPPSADSLFKFAFVRHPIDRFLSCWRMFTKGAVNINDWSSKARCNISIKEFAEITFDDSISYSKRSNLKERIRHHTIPQTHEFNCLHHADFIGRFETIENDFSVICEKLGISVTLPHMRKTSQDSNEEVIPDDVMINLRTFYARDFDELGY